MRFELFGERMKKYFFNMFFGQLDKEDERK